MILDAFLLALATRGVTLRIEGDRHTYDGPPRSMLAVDLEMLCDHKAELIECLIEVDPFVPNDQDDAPAWVNDESLAVRTDDARASIDHHQKTLRANAKAPRRSDQQMRKGRTR